MFSTTAPFGSNTFGLNHGSGGFASNANPFGSSPSIGSAAFGASKIQAFGSEGTSGASSTSAIGISSSSCPFGASTGPSFGVFSTPNLGASTGTSPALGSNLFGASTGPSYSTMNFGAPIVGTTGFGTSSSSQSGSSTSPSFMAFKTPNFGVPTASTPTFGTSSSSLFGASTNLFGAFTASNFQNSSSPTFGNSTSNPFGTSTRSTFGAFSTPNFSAPTGKSSMIGNSSSNPFGNSTSSTFKAFTTPNFSAPTGKSSTFGNSSSSQMGTLTNSTFAAFSTPNFNTPTSTSSTFENSSGSQIGTFTSSPSFRATFGNSSSNQFDTSISSTFLGFSTPNFSTPTVNSSTFGNSSSSEIGTLTSSPSFRAYPAVGFDAPSACNPALGCQPQGSRLNPYSATREPESSTMLQSLSAMPIYNNKSHEELRWEDYKSVGEDGGKAKAAFPGLSSGPTCKLANYSWLNTSSPFSASFMAVTPSVVGPTATWSQHTSAAPFVDQSKMTFNTTSSFAKPTALTWSSFPASNNLGSTSSISTAAAGSTNTPFSFAPSHVPCATVVNTEPTVSVGPTSTWLHQNAFARSTDQLKMSFNASSSLPQQTNSTWTSSPAPFSFLNSEVPSSIVVSTEPTVSVPPTATWLPPTAFAPSADQSKMTFNTPSSVSQGMMAPCLTTPPTLPAYPLPNGNNSLTKMPQGVHDSCATASSAPAQSTIAELPAPQSTCVTLNLGNPFETLPSTKPGLACSSPLIQYGISSMPVVDKPAQVRMSALVSPWNWRPRRISKVPVRKYDPLKDGPKVPFYSYEDMDSRFLLKKDPKPTSDKTLSNETSQSCEAGCSEESIFNMDFLKLSWNPTAANSARCYNHWKIASRVEHEVSNKKITSDIEAMMPKLQKLDYYIEPPVKELAAKERARPGFCQRVEDFVIGRVGYGSIKFLGETNVCWLDVESLVQFNKRELIVNLEDGSNKTPFGQGLNKAAEVTLLNFKIFDKKNGEQHVNGPKVDKYREMLRKKAADRGVEYVSFNPKKGEWRFLVQHF